MIEMPNDSQAGPSAGSVREVGSYPINLTGPRSHTLVLKPGVGSLSMGPSQLGKRLTFMSRLMRLSIGPYSMSLPHRLALPGRDFCIIQAVIQASLTGHRNVPLKR